MGILIVLIRLLLIAVVLYVIVYVFQAVRKAVRAVNNPFRPSENCPMCQQSIQVTDDNMMCPYCKTALGRSPDGKLNIKVN